MDLVGYSQEVFEQIKRDYTEFAARLDVTDVTFIPMSALVGDNVTERSSNMPWYKGRMLLDHLENVHIASDHNFIDLRFPVQYVLRPDRTFRGYLGTVASGIVRPGDEVAVIPSGMRTRIKSVFGPDGELDEAFPPLSAGVTVEDDIDISRGDMLVHVHNVPKMDRTLDAMVVWMNEEPMTVGKEYLIKHTTRTVQGAVSTLRYRVDVNTLHRSPEQVLRLNEIGRCVLTLSQPLVFDSYKKNRLTGSFVIIDRLSHNTVGAGMITDRESGQVVADLDRATAEPRSRHVTAHRSQISEQERAERMGGIAKTVWLTGLVGSGKTSLAYALERRLFDLGRSAYVIDGENARLGFSRDLSFTSDDRRENIRRAAEFAHMLNEAGLIAICSFLSPAEADRDLSRQIIGSEKFMEVYLSAPLEACRRRDAAGIYALAEKGEIENLPGLSTAYEVPKAPDLIVPTHELTIEAAADRVLSALIGG